MITPETRLPNAISSLAPSVQITLREKPAAPDSAVVDPALIPKTQFQNGPQMKTPVTAAAAVFVEHSLDELIVKIVTSFIDEFNRRSPSSSPVLLRNHSCIGAPKPLFFRIK
jgi:hypothetical protein